MTMMETLPLIVLLALAATTIVWRQVTVYRSLTADWERILATTEWEHRQRGREEAQRWMAQPRVGITYPPPPKALAGSRYGGQSLRKGRCAYCGTHAGDLRHCVSCGAPNPWHVARDEAMELRPRVGVRLPVAEPEWVTRMIPTDVSWR